MPTFEERLTAIEQEHAELKQKIELQTMAIGGLVNKAMLEHINEKNDKIFQALITHDEFTNQQLAALRDVEVQVDGKIVGMQAEMRQRFDIIVGMQAEMRQRFDIQDKKFAQIDTTLAQILARLPEKP